MIVPAGVNAHLPTVAELLALELTDDDRQQMAQVIAREEAVETHKHNRPSDFYRPHTGGQRQFHRSSGIVRCLFPGNGFGKTTAAGNEANWWLTHTHPFQKTPKWPVIIIWCCETFKQFKILRPQLEQQCLDKPFTFNKSDHIYTFPDGGMMFLVSGDSSWTHVQGINPDLVIFDEEPPEALWNEMKMRRRGVRKTRYVFAATATQGMTWMHRDLYKPWLTHHLENGFDERTAMLAQAHEMLWVWARGGITDNPGADAGDRKWYSSQTFNSEAERAVRLGGGFADFSGTPVFDLQALELQQPYLEDGQLGRFVHVPPVNADDPRCITVTDRDGTTRRVRLAWTADGPGDRGRIAIYRQPLPGHRYVIGHDSAYGLRKGDFDGAVVLDRETGEQVAEAMGHWGDAQWAEILFALGWHYNQAFLCGERQVGLMVMRRLLDEMHYSYQYFRRDESKRDRRPSDDLGHHRTAGDLTIPRLRRAIGPRDVHGRLAEAEIRIRSHELHRQMVKYQFRPKRATEELHECHDADLEYGAPRGDHDDLVLACGYAQMAMHEVAKFQPQDVPYPEGSAGELFNMRETFHPTPKQVDPFDRE